MAVKSLISIEEYLAMSFEHGREYVRGAIVERGMPTFTHANIEAILSAYFMGLRRSRGLFGVPELRVRLSADVVRIPDFSVFEGQPDEFPSSPPLIGVEISSPDDRLHATLEKLAEYRAWGVRHIWLIEPQLPALYTYDGSLTPVEGFEIPEHGVRISAAEIFRSR